MFVWLVLDRDPSKNHYAFRYGAQLTEHLRAAIRLFHVGHGNEGVVDRLQEVLVYRHLRPGHVGLLRLRRDEQELALLPKPQGNFGSLV